MSWPIVGFRPRKTCHLSARHLKKHFIVALQSNRTVALSPQDKAHGRFVRIDTLDWSDPTPVTAWIKGLPFPVLLHRQVFTNKDEHRHFVSGL